jgi:hypothetical protein
VNTTGKRLIVAAIVALVLIAIAAVLLISEFR